MDINSQWIYVFFDVKPYHPVTDGMSPFYIITVKFTVITVCFNAADSIARTIRSVIGQTYKDLEYIIVDGGSTDGTLDIINSYPDRISKILCEPDHGIYDAMNKGIRLSHGDYVCFMNAGDCFFSSMTLEKVAAQIHGEDIVSGISHLVRHQYWIPIRPAAPTIRIAHGHNVNHQATLIRREVLGEGYDTRFPIIADDLFFVDQVLFRKASYKRLWQVVSVYDINGISSNPKYLVQIHSERETFLLEHLPQLPDFSSFSFKFSLLLEKIIHKLLTPYIRFCIEKQS